MNIKQTNSHIKTQYLDVSGGRIAYDVMGTGPLVVLSPGMADIRSTYRFLAPLIAAAGYRVVTVDLRGHGESSTGWSSYTHADTAKDLLALIEELGGPATLVGQSFSGGAATIAATSNPLLISRIVEIDPFTRPPKLGLSGLFHNTNNYRRGGLALGMFFVMSTPKSWKKYLKVAFPGKKPADWDTWLETLLINLSQPGRIKAAKKMATSKATITLAGSKVKDITCPTLVIMGSHDSDFADPLAEARALVSLMPKGVGRYEMIEGAGHYPHAQYPEQTAKAILSFLEESKHA